MIRELGKHEEFWKNKELWENLIEFVKGARVKNRDDEEEEESGYRKHMQFKKLFMRNTWFRHNNKVSTEKKIKSEKFIQDAKIY